MLSKILPFTRKISMSIYLKYSQRINKSKVSFPQINIFEFVSGLVLVADADIMSKIQFLMILFDFDHENNKTFASTLVIFQSMVSSYCKLTKQEYPSYADARNYYLNCLLKAGLRQDSDISLKKIQLFLDSNEQIQALFKRFQPENVFQQTHTLFKKFPIYLESQIKQIQISITQLYLPTTAQSHHKRSLSQSLVNTQDYQNSKKVQLSSVKVEKSSHSLSKPKLPSIPKNKQVKYNNIPRLIFIGGTTISKDNIYSLLEYFYKLSGGEEVILYEDFLQNFQQLTFMKKMISNTFRFLDTKQKGKITFQNLLGRLFPSLATEDLRLIKAWIHQYRTIYQIQYSSNSNNNTSNSNNNNKQKQKQQAIILPPHSLIRLKQIFKVLDHGNKGYLTLNDLKKSFKIGYNANDLQLTFKTLDPQGTNKLNLRQLARLLLPGNYQIEGLTTEN